MKHKLTALLLAGLLAVLTGCSLAQPEKNSMNGNRFVGFYVVYGDSRDRDTFWNSENANTAEIGTMPVNTQWGRLDIPQTGLLAEARDDGFTFPGLDGFSLFINHQYDEDGTYAQVVSDMDSGDKGMAVSDTDEGTTYTINGAIYIGPPLDAGTDWEWYEQSNIITFYRVYESPEGTIYLDGSGNSIPAALGAYSEKHTYNSAVNGKDESETVEVRVEVRYAPRLENLAVSQFDENNTLLRSDDLALREDLPEAVCLEETAWVLVEEQSTEGTVRTAYSVPDGDGEPLAHHTVILLDEYGLGRPAELDIRFSSASAYQAAY